MDGMDVDDDEQDGAAQRRHREKAKYMKMFVSWENGKAGGTDVLCVGFCGLGC
jgi:hypothetical protein